MDTRQYLNQVKKYDAMIKNKLTEYRQISELIYTVSSPLVEEKVQTDRNFNKTTNLIVEMVDIEREMQKMIEQRSIIIRQIESVADPDSYDVLAKRYILGMRNKEIACEKNESERNIVRMIDNAITKFECSFGSLYLQD